MRKTVYERLAAFVVSFALLAAACASGPKIEKAPDWATTTPPADSTYTYFVGYADGTAAEDTRAFDAALTTLIGEIMRYMGVKITAETSAEARSTLDTFEANLVQTVKQTSTGRMAGFQVVEKFIQSRPSGVSVYLLGRYQTKELEAEKRRLAAVFQERIDAVARPEAEARALLASGDPVGAARKFIEAAVAASSADIDNAEIKFERNITAAREALGRISMQKLSDNQQFENGAHIPEPFRATALADGKPIPQVPVIVGYQVRQANGRMTTRTATIVGGADGVIAFTPPTPDYSGKATLTMRLDLSAALEPLFNVKNSQKPLVAALEDAISEKRVSFSYTILSRARTIPTAVALVDLDAAGAPAGGTTATALLQTLSRNSFKVSVPSFQNAAIVDKSPGEVHATFKGALGATYQRLIYGVSRVVSVRQDGNQQIATVSIDVQVLELSSGRVLYSIGKQAMGLGPTPQAAIEAARRQLGQTVVGEDLAANLP